MLEDTDLDAAVAEGIVSPAQAAALRELAARRTRERAISQGHEERFRFMRGFNDVLDTRVWLCRHLDSELKLTLEEIGQQSQILRCKDPLE